MISISPKLVKTRAFLLSLFREDKNSDLSSSSYSIPPSPPPRDMIILNILNLVNHAHLNDTDELPESLKSLLSNGPLPISQIDSIVLQLLHCHREDTQPSTKKSTSNHHHHHHHQRRTCPRPATLYNKSRPHFDSKLDKLNASANEFHPFIPNHHSTSLKTPIWSFAPSPLGTPKFKPPPTTYIDLYTDDTSILSSSNSIPSHPWFNNPLPPLSFPPPTVSCPSALQWGLSPAMADEMAHFSCGDSSTTTSSLDPLKPLLHHHHDHHLDVPLIALQEPEQEDFATLLVNPSSFDISSHPQDFNIPHHPHLYQQEQETHQPPPLHQHQHDAGLIPDWKHSSLATDISFSDNLAHQTHPTHPSSHDSGFIQQEQDVLPSTRSRSPSKSPKPPFHRQISSRELKSPNVGPRLQQQQPLTPHTILNNNDIILNGGISGSRASSPQPSDSSIRICRFYLQGSCLRSDCKFSHDVGKAVCKFWLRGNCLKGETRCEFLHEIPEPTISQHSKPLDPSFSTSTFKQKQIPNNTDFPSLHEATFLNQPKKKTQVPPVDSDFPSLAESLLGGKKRPNLSRWATTSGITPSISHQPREVELRPSLLWPALSLNKTKKHGNLSFRLMTVSNSTTRSSFAGERRDESLARSKQCWSLQDETGANRSLEESEKWQRRLSEDTRLATSQLISERTRLIKDVVILASKQTTGRLVDEKSGADRIHRGKEMGGGICLGVVDIAALEGRPGVVDERLGKRTLSVKERMEVVLDVHGLKEMELLDYSRRFLESLKTESFEGLAYLIISSPSSSSSSSPSTTTTSSHEEQRDEFGNESRSSSRSSVEELSTEEDQELATSQAGLEAWLTKTGYKWARYGRMLCIDPVLSNP